MPDRHSTNQKILELFQASHQLHAVAECDSERDFAGHVGGDDFVVLFQSPV